MPDLSSNSQKELLALSRNAIRTFLETSQKISVSSKNHELELHRACFVTLMKQKKLRGCIGTFDAAKPLAENVMAMSIAAATEDPRFPGVTLPELNEIKISISVLGEREKISSTKEIEIGKHGILVKCGSKSGTFLPEVAVDQKWDAENFFNYCALEKAGLMPQEISQAELFRYEVQKISET